MSSATYTVHSCDRCGAEHDGRDGSLPEGWGKVAFRAGPLTIAADAHVCAACGDDLRRWWGALAAERDGETYAPGTTPLRYPPQSEREPEPEPAPRHLAIADPNPLPPVRKRLADIEHDAWRRAADEERLSQMEELADVCASD